MGSGTMNDTPFEQLPDTSTHVLSLVSSALDEFETVALDATVRRALRIARLRGDAVEAFRFGLELGLVEDEFEAKPDPSGRGTEWRERERDAFLRSRTANVRAASLGHEDGGPVIYSSPLDELVIIEPAFESELSLTTRMENHNRKIVLGHIFASVRNFTYRYLIGCETELRLSITGERLFGRHRLRVDRTLRESAPDVLDRLSSAIRRAGETGESESRSQALLSCRRVLVAVADLVFAPSKTPHIDSRGNQREVGQGNYRNRIMAALDQTTPGTLSKALQATIEDFASRLDRLDELTQKGVHDEVTEAEMEFGIVQTYLLAGEVLAITLAKGDS